MTKIMTATLVPLMTFILMVVSVVGPSQDAKSVALGATKYAKIHKEPTPGLQRVRDLLNKRALKEQHQAAQRIKQRRAEAKARAEARAAAAVQAKAATPAVAQQPSVTVSVTGNRAIGQDMAAARGWTGEQFQCLDLLWTRESGWNTTASNPSGAYGIPQALPGSKMATAGSDWATNPATQISWGLSYIAGRYGTPCGAWSHSQSYGWY